MEVPAAAGAIIVFREVALLTLMTWNVRYFGHGAGGLRATQAGIDAVARALTGGEALPDVIALQEVETVSLRGGLHPTPQLDRLTGAMEAELLAQGRPKRYRSLYFPAHVYTTPLFPLYTTGLALLVAEPLEVEATSRLDITHRRFRVTARMKQTRVCAHARLRLPSDQRIDVFNTHLSLPAFFTRDLPRLPWRMGHGENQLEEIRAVADFVREKAGPHAVLVGDFNSAPDSPVYAHLLASGGLRDPFREVMAPERVATWATNGLLNLRMHIDHVFSTPTVRWLDFDGSHPFDERGTYFGISDHVPKVGRLALT